QRAMSALPPKADMCSALAYVCFGPKADSCTAAKRSLFDHLIGAGEQRRRNFEAKCFSGLEVNHQLVLSWRLNWHVSWVFALEDAVDIAGGTPERVDEIRSIGNQAAAGGINAGVIDRGQSMPCCERNNQLAMDDGGRAPGYDEATVRALREPRDGA